MKRLFTILALLLSGPSHAADQWVVYAKLGVAMDLNPQWDMVMRPQENGIWAWQRQDFLRPGALDAVTLGVERGPIYSEVGHISAIPDGFKGHGLSWWSVGLRIDLWRSRQ